VKPQENLACPFCGELQDGDWRNKCKKCLKTIKFCDKCQAYSPLISHTVDDTPTQYDVCQNCNQVFEVYVWKSKIYGFYNFSFKFANRCRLAYYEYFARRAGEVLLPVGKIEEDLGEVKNDFIFEYLTKRPLTSDVYSFIVWRGIDDSSSRAFVISVNIEDGAEPIKCICLTHETGLEIFLISAGTFAGLEIARFGLTRVLETLEKKINEWFKKNRHIMKRIEDLPEPFVDHIKIRTSHWELSLDSRFSHEEKLAILDHVAKHLTPKSTIADFLKDMPDKTLQAKSQAATEAVVQIKQAENDQEPTS
jgi:hypothetical protein